jgi:hypothetical protein
MNTDSLATHQKQPTEGMVIARLIGDYKRAPKLKTIDPNTDPEFAAKVAHVLKPGEKLMQFVARTCLGRTQALAMSRDEISRRVAQAEANRREEMLPPPDLWEPKRPPQHFLLDSFAE